MRLIFLGTGSFGVPALEAVLNAGHEVLRCISQPDRPAGRGRRVEPTPVHAAAERLGLPHIQAADVNALAPAEVCDDAELGLVAAFGQKIGPALLAALPRGMINIHGSLLPKYRGAAPYQWAILNGEVETGVTVFQLNDRWDAGAVWESGRVAIGVAETADELHENLAQLGARVIVPALARIASGAQPTPQDMRLATRAPKLSRADSHIDFTAPRSVVIRRIHGLWSWPAATCIYAAADGRREQLQLARAAVADAPGASGHAAAAGTFLADLSLQCGDGAIRLLEVKPAGGRLMSFRDFANGRRIAPGDRLERVDPGA